MAVCTFMPLRGEMESKMALNGSLLLQFSLNRFTDGEDYCSYIAKAFPFSHFESHVSVVNACFHCTGSHVYKP